MFDARSLLRDPSRNDISSTNCNSFLDTQIDSESSLEEEMTKCIRSVRTLFAVATANNYPTEFAGVPGLSSAMPSSQPPLEGVTMPLMFPREAKPGFSSELPISRYM